MEGRDRAVVVDVPGPVEHEAGDYTDLLDGIRRLVEDGHKRILLNVAQVAYGDSVLLGAIMQIGAGSLGRSRLAG